MSPARLSASLLLALLLFSGLAHAQEAPPGTLLQAAQAIQSGALGLVASSVQAAPQPTWGQAQARQDLEALASAAGELAAAMESGDTGGLADATTGLEVARTRVKTSLALLGLAEAEASGPALLDLASRLAAALRQVDQRFLGRAQVGGSRLGALPLDAAAAPLVYDSPEALLREARGVRSAAERMLADLNWNRIPGGPGRGPLRPALAPFNEEDLRKLVRSACDFEAEVGGGYDNVTSTYDSYLALRRAWQHTLPYVGGSFGNFAAWDLERAMKRLEAFYSEVER